MDELISVIIPVFNAAPYLENCLDSVLGQTYPNIEIIVVDDGSTDRSGEIADSYTYRFPGKVKSFHQKNSGVSTARINGTKAACGAWIGFVDADDEIEPDMYERLMRNARKYNADISHCGHQTIVNGGERIHYFYNTGRLAVQDRESALKELLVGDFEPSLCTKLFRKELFSVVSAEGSFDRTVKYHEDLLMNFFLFSKAVRIVYEDFCAYHYMARKETATRSSFRIEKALDPVKVSRTILENAAPELKSAAWHNYLICCMNGFISICGRAEYKEQAEGLKKALIDNRGKRNLLSRNERIKLAGILTAPGLFKRCYHFYVKYFQNRVFE